LELLTTLAVVMLVRFSASGDYKRSLIYKHPLSDAGHRGGAVGAHVRDSP
jgi:hypothetical protein